MFNMTIHTYERLDLDTQNGLEPLLVFHMMLVLEKWEHYRAWRVMKLDAAMLMI